MKTVNKTIAALGVLFILFSIGIHIVPCSLTYMGSLLSLLGLILSMLLAAIKGITQWRKSTQFWMVPMAISILFISTGTLNRSIGHSIADRIFQTRLNEYMKIVDDVKSGVITCGEKFTIVKSIRPPSGIARIFAARSRSEDAVAVLLVLDTGLISFAHECYFYDGYTDVGSPEPNVASQFMSQWELRRRITGNWYHMYQI